MLCKVQIETLSGCCCLGRHCLAVWGYLKAIVSAVVFYIFALNLNDVIYYLPDFHGSVLCIMSITTIHIFVDVLLQVMLIFAYHKKMESRFSAYFKYTKILWAMVIIYGGMYSLCIWIDPDHFYYSHLTVDVMLYIGILLTLVSAIIQTIIWQTIMKERADVSSQTNRVFKVNFTVKIGVPTTDKITEQADNAEEIITEKRKFTK